MQCTILSTMPQGRMHTITVVITFHELIEPKHVFPPRNIPIFQTHRTYFKKELALPQLSSELSSLRTRPLQISLCWSAETPDPWTRRVLNAATVMERRAWTENLLPFVQRIWTVASGASWGESAMCENRGSKDAEKEKKTRLRRGLAMACRIKWSFLAPSLCLSVSFFFPR